MVFSFYNVALTIPFLMLLLGTFEIKNVYFPNVRTRGDMAMRVKKSQKNASITTHVMTIILRQVINSNLAHLHRYYTKSLVDADISLLLVN